MLCKRQTACFKITIPVKQMSTNKQIYGAGFCMVDYRWWIDCWLLNAPQQILHAYSVQQYIKKWSDKGKLGKDFWQSIG